MKKFFSALVFATCCTVCSAQNNSSDSTDIFFQHLNLNEIIVSGPTGNIRMKDSSSPIKVVLGKELRTFSSTNIIDAISNMPGVAQITTGGGISKPVIRGLGYNRIVTISDGVRQEGQQWGDEHGIEIDGQSVGRVEILKGPASLIYGSDAMAGVLLLHGENLPTKPVEGSVMAEYQSNNGLYGYSASISGKENDWLWRVRYSGKLAHEYKNRIDGYVPGSQFKEQSVNGLIGKKQHWGHSLLKLGYYKVSPSIIEGERDEEDGTLERATNKRKTYGNTLPFQRVEHWKATSDNLFYTKNGQLKAVVAYQNNRRKEFEESHDESELDLALHTITYDFRYTTTTRNSLSLNIGTNGMWQRSLNYGEEYIIPNYRLFDFGTYMTAYRHLNNVVVNAGIRYDVRQTRGEQLFEDEEERFAQFSRNYHGLSGSTGMVWHTRKGINLRANMSTGFRAPNISELASNGVHEGTFRYEIGNRNLKAERSTQLDLGFDFTTSIISGQLSMFANKIDNYIYSRRIDLVMEEDKLTYIYDCGDASLMGFEAEVDFHPIHQIHIESGFSYVNARQMHQPDDKKYLPMTPAPRLTSNIKYEILHDGTSLNNLFISAGIECNLRQNHYFKAYDTETATPSYTLVNIAAGGDILYKKKTVAEIYLNVDNVFNRAYQNHLNRLKYTDINTRTGHMGIFNMGRNISLKIIVPLF